MSVDLNIYESCFHCGAVFNIVFVKKDFEMDRVGNTTYYYICPVCNKKVKKK